MTVEPYVAIDLAQLTINLYRRYALCIQKLYHRPHFTAGRCSNKSLHLQPLQRCFCENSRSPASTCVMRRHYSITYIQSFHSINGLIAVGQVRYLLCERPSCQPIRLIYHCNLINFALLQPIRNCLQFFRIWFEIEGPSGKEAHATCLLSLSYLYIEVAIVNYINFKNSYQNVMC